jgi:hypothetical protein
VNPQAAGVIAVLGCPAKPSLRFAIGKPLEGKTPTQVNVGTDDTTDSDGNANSTSPPVTLPSGDNPAIDFGYL